MMRVVREVRSGSMVVEVGAEVEANEVLVWFVEPCMNADEFFLVLMYGCCFGEVGCD